LAGRVKAFGIEPERSRTAIILWMHRINHTILLEWCSWLIVKALGEVVSYTTMVSVYFQACIYTPHTLTTS